MAAPQFQLAISQKLLQKIVAEALPSLITIANPSDADGSNPRDPNPQWVTEFEITEVVPLRADDTVNMDATGTVTAIGIAGRVPANEALKQIRGAIQAAINNGNINLPKAFDLQSQRTYVSNTPGLQPITVPATFLLVSCSFRQVSSDDLHANHTSDFQAPSVFKRGTNTTNAILLQLDVAPRNTGVSLSVQLVGVFDAQGATLALETLQGINPAFVGTQGTTIPLDNMVGQLPGLIGVVNVGITTAPWPDVNTPPALGVRIGFDLMIPDDISGWTNFHTSSLTWEADALGGMSDISVVADAGMLQKLIQVNEQALLNDPTNKDVQKALSQGLGFGTADLQVVTEPDGSAGLRLHVPVAWNSISAGDAYLNLELSSGDDSPKAIFGSHLNTKVCINFQGNLATDILGVLILALAFGFGAILVAPYLAVIAVVVGIIVGIIGAVALDSKGNALLQGGLAGFHSRPPLSCGAPDPSGCRSCQAPADLPPVPPSTLASADVLNSLAPFPFLKLATAVIGTAGVHLSWKLAPGIAYTDTSATLSIRGLDETTWETGPWTPFGALPCQAVDPNPSKSLTLMNTGVLPMKVYWVGQFRPGSTPLLKVESGPEQLADPNLGIVSPNVRVLVHALTSDPSYDSSQPPPLFLRILTNAGFRDFDINQPPAQPPPAAVLAAANQHAQLNCQHLSLATSPEEWTQITFTDPVPFSIGDSVHESLDVTFAGTAARPVEAYDSAGNQLATAHPVQGVVNFSVAAARVPASSHTKPGISVVTAALGAVGLARQTASHYQSAISRWLYRQSGAAFVGAPIRNLHAHGMSLVTLTERDLQVLSFSPGRMVLRDRVPLIGGLRVEPWKDGFVILTRQSVFLLQPNEELDPLWINDPVELCTHRGELWLADGEGIAELGIERGRITKRRKIPLRGISALASTAHGIFVLVSGRLWRAGSHGLEPLAVWGRRLTVAGDGVAVTTVNEVLVLNSRGELAARYPSLPWTTSLIYLGGYAIEALKEDGVLVAHERYRTFLDFGRAFPGA